MISGNIPAYIAPTQGEMDPAQMAYFNSLSLFLTDIVRRAVDGTVPINLTTLVLVGNLKITTAGSGLILTSDASSNTYLLSVTEQTNDDGSIQPSLKLTKQ